MLIERALYKEVEKYLDSREAIIITGMRRVGKTSFLKYIQERIGSNNALFIDLENPLNRKIFEAEDYEKIKTTLELKGLKFNEKAFLFLDEIQLSKNIPSAVKYLQDNYNIKCFLTGSSSFYIKNLFSESLSGRKYIFELFPLDFEEYLRLSGVTVKPPENFSGKDDAAFILLSNHYDSYLTYGGFPEIALLPGLEEKKKKLEDIFTSYFQLEVLRFGDFRKNNAVRDLIMLLAERVGTKLDFDKLASLLGISRITVKEYILFLESTYFINLVRPFGTSRDSEIKKMPKIYLCDSGIANMLARIDKGYLFENNVYQNLKLRGTVNYYQRKKGPELDFILNKLIAFEAKLDPDDHDLTNLKKLAGELKMEDYKLVAKNYPRSLKDMAKVRFGFNI